MMDRRELIRKALVFGVPAQFAHPRFESPPIGAVVGSSTGTIYTSGKWRVIMAKGKAMLDPRRKTTGQQISKAVSDAKKGIKKLMSPSKKKPAKKKK